MEDVEKQKKLEAGKAKLAEYRQRKAYADSQKKQKKKKKKRSAVDSEGDSVGKVEVEQDQSVGGEEGSGEGDGSQEGNKGSSTKEFTFARTLRSGETVKHDQTYTVEPESEVSTTAEDCSSEEEVEPSQQVTKGSKIQNMEDTLAAKTQPMDQLNQELEEDGGAFGTELQDFEAALKQRDGFITQLTTNLQQAREEKDEIMKEFLELTEQSQKLQIQFQQLQAGETLRNTSHSSTAADLLQARQQLTQYQQQLEEMNVKDKQHQERSSKQLELIGQLQHKLSKIEMCGKRSEESFTERINEKDLLIAEQEKTILNQEQSLANLRIAEETFAQTLKENNQFISEQTAIITEHELSLTLLRKELNHVGGTTDKKIIHQSDEKDLIIAEQERVISERECSLAQLEDELESSEKHQHNLQQRMAAKELELERCMDELESTKSNLESCKSEIESYKLEMENQQTQLEISKSELATSRQKERLSSNEIMQLMGTVEDLQKRYHQGNLSESDTIQKVQEETVRKLEGLRAELDEMYGQQIVQMKQELNLQHAARVEQITVQHLSELEVLKAQLLSESSAFTVEVNTLNAKIGELQEILDESQGMHDKATEEKSNLQAKVNGLLQDLHSAKEKLEQVSHSVVSQESQQFELLHLQETIDNLKRELAVSQEVREEAEAKHDSELTNCKIKLEMMEREKDAVLDRMAESQEAELERLRTHLLFSHEEELTNLREDLQRESFLNTENLLNEAAVKHEKALDELRIGYEETLHLLQRESATFATERVELLHQISGLKEDLKLALHSSKADELIQQLQELQVELEELRKGEEQAQMENKIQTLLKKTEVLENQSREQERCWENKWKEQVLEKEILMQSNKTLNEDLNSKVMKIETLTVENNQIHQRLAELSEEIEKQRTTFSFAEKNFEVNYHELKEEYACLIETKTLLEERTLKETFEFEAKIASLQSQIRELEEISRCIKTEQANTDLPEKAVIEKDTTELMEKLNVALSEKKSLTGRLSKVKEQLMFTEGKVGQLGEELLKVRQEKAKVIARNESLRKELDKKQETKREQAKRQHAQRKLLHEEPGCSFDDHHLQIQSLQEQMKTLQSLLQAAESERDGIRHTLELQRLSQIPSPVAAVQSPREESIKGQSSLCKSTVSGSSRRKRRQRSKQERTLGTAVSDCRDEQQREEEEEAAEEEERATSAAESETQPQMQSQVMSCSRERASKEDSSDGCQGDEGIDCINKWVSRHGTGHHMEPVVCRGPEEEGQATEHGECRLEMEAQRISLSQIHAAQLELLQEETDARTHSLELKLQNLRDHGDHDEPKIFKHNSILQAMSEDCSEIIRCFERIFGEDFIKSVDAGVRQLPSMERPETSESTSIILQASELYRDLQQVRATIELEHLRMSQLQVLLRAEGNKMMELQTAYEELKSSSEKEISDLRLQVASMSPPTSKDLVEPAGAPSPCLVDELQRMRAEEQEKQLQLEESHRQEVEHLRAHYRQQAAETEERYLTELFMLQKRLQEVTGTQTHFSVPESSPERMEEHTEQLLKDLSKDELSEGGVELHSLARSEGLTVQLQLRKALSHKYAEEVAALKEQHNRELDRLRGERRAAWKREEQEESGEEEQNLERVNGAGRSMGSLGAAEQVVLEEKQDWERVEEEVAKAIVQMSVRFAQQTELAQINKRACQRCTSMQTQVDEDKVEDREVEERTPRASRTSGAWLEEVEKERLERELEERDAEIRKLKEKLQKTELATEQTLKNKGDHQEEVEEEPGVEQPNRGKLASHDDGDSLDEDSERNVLRKANKKLSQVLVEVLKTTAAAEETMGLHMKSLGAPHSYKQRTTEPLRPLAAGHLSQSWQGSETGADDASLWSREMEAETGLEMSQQMMESLLLGVGTQLENEEYLMGISSRLQTALENMLMAINDTTNQLEHARMTQTELMRESFRHNQEINELLQKQEDLQERLSEEARAREQLALELHRAEGLIDGYTGERASLEEQLRQKEELQLSLEQELQVTGSQLHELEQERLQMQEERELLSRQQDAMRENAGPRELRLVEAAMVAAPEADLLEETEKLMKEKVDVQRQAEKENSDLLKQVKLLEAELEEQVNRVIELEQAQRTESGDLQQQVQALEKQLEKNRRFLDEQAVDREHERDFFQQEIQKLEQQLKNPQKLQTGSEQRNQEVDGVTAKVDQLTSQLKEKADWCSELLLSSEQLRRELGERDEEIDKLESRIRELEQALLASAESLEKDEQKKQHASITEAKHSTLEAQLQTEREALERKEKEICNLEEQLEQFREELENKSEEVQQLHMQLEIQRKEISSQQENLETRESMLQVMEEKDREVALLNEQITKLQHTETASDNKEIDDRDELIKDLECLVQCLRSDQERLNRNNEEELDQLNAVIDKLQQELANIEQKQTSEEYEDTKPELENCEWGPSENGHDEMKQRLDLVSKELNTLKTEHSELLETYLHLKERTETLAETEKLQSSETELEDALREKTAGFVVMQAQIQALEQSATSRVKELDLRILELEDLVNEKDCELRRCRLLVEQTQNYAEGLQQKVSNLEKNLREKVAAVVVSQAMLEAFQQQHSQRSKEDKDRQRHEEPHVEPTVYDVCDYGIPQMDSGGIGQVPTGKAVRLTDRLRELEVGLTGMQKDQELQKQLLSSSEEEVLEYERRLSVLMDLLTQMKARTHQRIATPVGASFAHDQPAVSDILQELQEVRDEVSSNKEQLDIYKDTCSRLQEELKEKTVAIEKLQDQLKQVSSGGSNETKVSELQEELMEAQNEAAAAKEELNSCKESLEKLQELLQEREMTIAHLKAQLFLVKAEEDIANMTDLLQEVGNGAASTKAELGSCRQHNERLQQDLQHSEVSISKFKDELQEMRQNADTIKEELDIHRQYNEKLQDEVQVRDLSISQLKGELQEMRQNADTTKEELDIYKQHNEELQEDLQHRDMSISQLKVELQEMTQNADTTKEELDIYKQHNEEFQQDFQHHDMSISQLKMELQEMTQNADTTKEELNSYRQHNEKLRDDLHVRELSISQLKVELQEMRQNLGTIKEELHSFKQHNEKLQDELNVRELSVSKLKVELQEMTQNADPTKEELDIYKQHNEELQQDLQHRDMSISQLKGELQEMRQNLGTIKEELHSFKQHNEKLQDELNVRELSVSKLKVELQEMTPNADPTKEELDIYKQHNEELQQDLQHRDMSISQLKGELQEMIHNTDTIKEELNSYRQHNEKLQDDLHVRELSISQLKVEMQEMRQNADPTKEGLDIYKQHNEELQQDLQHRDMSISQLKGELQEMRQNLGTIKEELHSFKQHNEKLQDELNVRELSVSKLKVELQEMTPNADPTKEELDIYKQHNEELQQDLQHRDMSISQLKGELQEMIHNADTIKEELNSYRQHNEKLQDDLHVRELSISQLKVELQEMSQNADPTKEELDIYKQHNEELQQDLQHRDMSISQLKGELQEMIHNTDTIKEELNSYRQHNEKLQDDLHVRELSISQLKVEMQEMRQNADPTKEELDIYKQHNEELQQDLQHRDMSISQLKVELQEMIHNTDTIKEELNSYRQHNEKLQDDLHVRELSISQLKVELQEMRQNADPTKEELDIYKQHNEELQQDLQHRDMSISQLKGELQEMIHNTDTIKEELNSYRQHNEKLQDDLHVRELSISQLKVELQEMRQNADPTKEELDIYKQHNEELQQDLQHRDMSISQLKGELQEMIHNTDTIKEELDIYKQHNEELQQDLQHRDMSISQLKGELQEMRQNLGTIKEELHSFKQHNEKLQDELNVHELSVSKLKDDLKVARITLIKTADSVPASPSPAPSPSPSPQPLSSSSSTTQPKRKGGKQLAGKGSSVKDKPSLSRKSSAVTSQSSNKSHSARLNSRPEQQHLAVMHSFTQTEPLQMSDLDLEGKCPTKDEMEEMVGEFQEKIAQMQELHAAEILDMEARHISESESLRRDTQALEDECKALKTVIDKLRSTKAVSSRQDHPSSQSKDGYISDSSSDYSQRPGFDFPSLQQELRTTPEGARRETDDPLPDRIKTLLREVHQEGMQVLSLSELPLCEGEPGSQFNIQGWAKEREDLLATVESLKGLITQMQTHSETQTSGGEDWRAELLDAVRQVFMMERCVLKSALYSQLDQLDTSDAIVHLNQLEHRLAEQGAQHRESMASLCAADRSSLISEIHQLRGQLEQIHQDAQPAASFGGECKLKGQNEGGGGWAVEADRLLLEELKCELSQTKLELETTLKAQHKHLKELDTLRAEVSQKAAEVDTLSEQLREERKTSRDLQWAMEKEKCRTGRYEESKREELEDLQLTLEEEKSRVAQLTRMLEKERKASSQLSQHADEERLSLQELQIQLESERAKVVEMSSALERERELRMSVFPESGALSEAYEDAGLLERLQRDLEDKHLQVVHLLSQVSAQRLQLLRKEEELTSVSQRSKRDEEALLEAQALLKRLEEQLSETQEQLEEEMDRRKRLEEEKERLEERLNQFRDQREKENAVRHSDSTDRTKDWVFQQKSGNIQSSSSSTYPHLEVSPTGPSSGPHDGPWRTDDKILGKLHLVSSKVHGLVSKTAGRPLAEVDSEDLSWLQSNIDEVITMLQRSPGLPAVPESVSLLAVGSSNSLTERLLRQNAELTGFVSRLTEEKNDLRNHGLRLEDEVRRHRQAGLRSGDSFSSKGGASKEPLSGRLLSQEQEAWTREKVRLEKALLLAQAQVARLRGEIRNDTLREITGPEADNAALKRMYGKYLRSESFRKALIYQKKYLLLLLGGFQECEEATLSLLTRMGGRPSLSSLESFSLRRRGLMRFRSAVRVSIALSRMRFLVKRWHKVTGMSSTGSCSINKNGARQTFGTDVRDSPYLHPGSVELYRERGGGGGGVSSSRGRSGRESPRSAASSTHHRLHMAGDHGALTCSHLQSYDPDRALTDYISRLEALQRRLGTVTSGASSYAQLHFGLRR